MLHFSPSFRTSLIAAIALLLAVPCSADEVPVVPTTTAAEPEGFFGGTMSVLRRCRLRCQTSAAGKLLANMVEPFSKLTGGIIPSCKCNEFNQALALSANAPGGGPPQPPSPAVAAAAKIQDDKAQAKIRRQAVASLAGVDCRYYPEAEVALIASLRADRSECVRLEAAIVLQGCCCRSPAVIKALTISAAGSDIDGNPCERSTRVRLAAIKALECCGACDPTQLTPTAAPEQPLSSTADAYPATQVSYEAAAGQPRADTPPIDPPAEQGQSLLELWKRAGQ